MSMALRDSRMAPALTRRTLRICVKVRSSGPGKAVSSLNSLPFATRAVDIIQHLCHLRSETRL